LPLPPAGHWVQLLFVLSLSYFFPFLTSLLPQASSFLLDPVLCQQLPINSMLKLASEMLLKHSASFFQVQKSLPHNEGCIILLFCHHTIKDLLYFFYTRLPKMWTWIPINAW
jgi:hypothetical protein